MKPKCLLLLLLLVCPIGVCAQTAEDMGKIVIGVAFQDGLSEETYRLRPQLEDKLVHFAAQAGCTSFDNRAFFISPNIVVEAIDVAESGMKTVYVARGELYLTIQDRNSGTVFASGSYPFRGSATEEEQAVRNGILNIQFENVGTLFSEAKSKILVYYRDRMSLIFAQANALAAGGDFDGAIACLMMMPEELTDLHEQALVKAQDIFDMKDEALRQQRLAERKGFNDSLLTQASNYLAMHQPEAALDVLSGYTPGDARQDAAYRQCVAQAERLVAAREKEARRQEERAYRDERRREDRAYQEASKQAAYRREMDRQENALRRQAISASERLVHHRLSVDQQKVQALKQVACDYIRNHPDKVDYLRIRF